MLNFDPEWRFLSPSTLAPQVVHGIQTLISRVSDAGAPQITIEHFKRYFATAAGEPYYSSSSASWARSDLERLMDSAAENAPLFIEAFYDACQALEASRSGPSIPIGVINRVLAENQAGFQVQPPDLVTTSFISPVAVEARALSLDDEARSLIQKSLGQAQQLLREGQGRQAVQESLWLLETVFTAFRGLPIEDKTVQGRYFNKISEELKRGNVNPHLTQVINWISSLHGYLSSPTGGGVRHGVDIASGIRLEENDALLYCNLIRSYINFIIDEHERLRSLVGR